MSKYLSLTLFKSVFFKKEIAFSIFSGVLILAAFFLPYSFLTAKAIAKQGSNNTSIYTNDILIKVKNNFAQSVKEGSVNTLGIPSLSAVLKKYNALSISRIAKVSKHSQASADIFSWYKVTLDDKSITAINTKGKGVSYPLLDQLLADLKKDPSVVNADYDFVVTSQAIPNDPYYASSGSWGQSYADMWGLHRVNAETAWDSTTGSNGIVVAVIDSGVDRNHADLSSNTWVNTNEIPNNGIDDDNNGYVDDYYGWNFTSNSNDPMDNNGHGTHVAGILAGVGNNTQGIAGINWQSSIMSVKFLGSNGAGSSSNAALALQYAADNGARVSSNSWGCSCQSQVVNDALQYEHNKGMIIVAAAGNNNADALDFSPGNNDNVITVGATDSTDALASFSNFGQKIDVVAPGVDILSAKSSFNSVCSSSVTVGTNYCRLSGTSMATPFVSGLAALVLAKNPALSNEEVRQIIRNNAVDLGTSGKDQNYGYGLINVSAAVASTSSDIMAPFITSPVSKSTIGGNAVQIQGTIPGPNFASYTVEIGAGRNPSSWVTLAASTTQVINGTLATFDSTSFSDGIYIIRVTAHDANGKIYQFQVHDIQISNFDATIVSPSYLVSASSGVTITGSADTKNGLAFSNYKIEYGVGTSPTSYFSSGIMLTNSGLTSITSGNLGTWNTSLLTSGQVYTLRLTVTAINGTSVQSAFQVTPDNHLVPGWPKVLTGTCVYCEGTPAMGDLLGNGKKEMAVLGANNQVYAYNKDGSLLPNFPVTVTAGDYFKWPAVVEDVDGDGKQEIIAAAITANNTARIYIIRGDGTLYPGWTMPELSISNGASFSDATPAIADLDNDGHKELVMYNRDSLDNHYLHAYHLDGTELAGFPVLIPLTDSTIQSSVAIADLNNDGKKEIILGDYDKLYVFDSFGNLLPGWPFQSTPDSSGRLELFQSTPAVGDINGDGKLEIFATAQPNGAVGSGTNMLLYAITSTGSVVSSFPRNTGMIQSSGWPLNSPSVGDFNRDGLDEAAAGSSLLTISSLTSTQQTQFQSRAGSAISDFKGDGSFEFVGSNCGYLHAANPDMSNFWQGSSTLSPTCFVDPEVTSDMDNNGKMEVGAILSLWNNPGTVVFLWEMDGGTNAAQYPWPMFGHDSAHTGRIQLPPDFIAPVASISTPLTSSTVSGKVGYSVTASDNVGVAKVEFYIDNKLLTTSTSSPYTTTWDTATYTNASHSLVAKAYDAVGNVGTSSTVNVTVNNPDTTAPTVSITSPVNGGKVAKGSSVTISATAADSGFVVSGVGKVQFYVNGSLQCTDTSTPYSCSWKVGPKSGTAYTLKATATDNAGNSASNSISVTSQ